MLFIFASLVILSISAFGQVGGASMYSTTPSSTMMYSTTPSSTMPARKLFGFWTYSNPSGSSEYYTYPTPSGTSEYYTYTTPPSTSSPNNAEEVTTAESNSVVNPPSPTADSCLCGIKNAGRIVGGNDVTMHEIPWQVMLKFDNSGGLCGGTLISNSTVLTAAHCVDGEISKYIMVSLGDHAMNTESGVDGSILVGVEKIIMHWAYNRVTIDNDIALLKLAKPVQFTNAISPACLPYGVDSNDLSGKTATVSGWGTTSEDGDISTTLQEVQLPLLTTEECQYYYGTSNITNNMICTYLPGKDSCQGDSGGPLVLEENGSNKVVGVVSWGAGCAQSGAPGVYTKVTNYLDWIQRNTGETYCSA